MVEIQLTNGAVKKVHFGASGYSDFTKHKDPRRKQRYIDRHESRENWSLTGIKTPGFWSRWILWNQPSIKKSVDDINRRFYNQIKVVIV